METLKVNSRTRVPMKHEQKTRRRGDRSIKLHRETPPNVNMFQFHEHHEEHFTTLVTKADDDEPTANLPSNGEKKGGKTDLISPRNVRTRRRRVFAV
jgi:hypothetical protein